MRVPLLQLLFSSRSLEVSTQSGRGRKLTRVITSPSPEGVELRVPVATIEGAEAGRTIVAIAGIHANEDPGVEALQRFFATCDPGEVRGTILLVPIANVPSFVKLTEGTCPIDGKDPFLCFPGNASGSFSDILAHVIFTEIVKGADCVIDLHSGTLLEALVPFVIYHKSPDEEVTRVSRELARAWGVHYIMSSVAHGTGGMAQVGGRSYVAISEAGIPALVTEAGGPSLGPERDQAVAINLRGLRNVMHYLGILQGRPPVATEVAEIQQCIWMTARHHGLIFLDAQLGKEVAQGQELGEIRDLFGTPIERVTAPKSGMVIVIRTLLSVGKGDLFMGIGVPA
jgi:predicted deacylase